MAIKHPMKKWALGLTAAWFCAAAALAQDKPTIRLLVGFPPGGGTDVMARLVGEKMATALNATVVVENKPGAGGRVAAEALKNAAADGSVVLITPPAPIVIAPFTFSKLPYNTEADFVPVAQIVRYSLAIATGGNAPLKNLADLLSFYKANPKQANFGTAAAGSQLHFLGMLLGQAAGVQLTHVPYQGGAPLNNDLMGGQIVAGIDQFPYELHKSGRIRMLATSGAQRSPVMPDVPTFAEQGFPTVLGDAWYGAYMHAKTPAATVQRIGAAIAAASRHPDVVQKAAALGLEATGLNAAEFAKVHAADRARWEPVVKASGFKAD
ncbi:MAG: tripartite tricarboxylate transporter substrate-binding protein [Pseudomonadota bacterium]|jgi:tripartite-type tricarboxylate transporter receptor subunit TctC